MQADEEGFLYPKVAHARCVDCSLCVKRCPQESTNHLASFQKENIVAIKAVSKKLQKMCIRDRAKAETVPVSPSKAKNTVLAGMLGLVISVGIVILRYLLNNKFMTDDDITNKLGLTVLGVIPQIDMKGER